MLAFSAENLSRGCLLLALGLAVCLGFSGFSLSSPLQAAFAGGAVALAGLPHGATDGWLALHGGLLTTRFRATCFFGAYVALALLVVAAWHVFPVVCLGLFLILSAWHFGDGGAPPSSGWLRIASGLVVLGAPAVMQGAEVARLYQVLSGPEARALAQVQGWLLGPACIVLCAAFMRNTSRRTAALYVLEHAALVGLASGVSPLLYFVAYFCGIHSVRHMGHVLRLARTSGKGLFWGSVGALTFASVGVGALVFFWLLRSGQAPEAAALRVTFVGLAALTLPHMLLVDGVHPWLTGRGASVGRFKR